MVDPVSEIKARLPIEDLVAQYCKVEKKGRSFKSLCPFHNDKKPSFLISPDKGIAYCFACQKGGDIFSVYQLLEGVDFPQAIRDLADKVGLELPKRENAAPVIKKDERERMRDCLESALSFYRKSLAASAETMAYLEKRGMAAAEIESLQLGYAPAGYTTTYDHLLKEGFSKTEIINAGLAIQKDLSDQRPYDRFRERLMIAIRDPQGRLIGFGGRAMRSDDPAKYINTPETPLYRKSEVLFGMDSARDAVREKRSVILVEGYFDVFACKRVGLHNTVACCGTALTEEHARYLKRHVDSVVLCLDSDRAGREAAERAFLVLAAQDVQVTALMLPEKDPADLALEQPDLLKQLLSDGGLPYVDLVLDEIGRQNLADPSTRRTALHRLIPLIEAVPSAVERKRLTAAAAAALGTVETALEQDIRAAKQAAPRRPLTAPSEPTESHPSCTKAELALLLFVLYPMFIRELKELIRPEDGMAAALYDKLAAVGEVQTLDVESLQLEPADLERLKILLLYWEDKGFSGWSDSTAAREIRAHCQRANQETILGRKLPDIAKRLREAAKGGHMAEEEQLKTQVSQAAKLAKISS